MALCYSSNIKLYTTDQQININTCRRESQTNWKDKSFYQVLCNNSESVMETGIFTQWWTKSSRGLTQAVRPSCPVNSKQQLSHKHKSQLVCQHVSCSTKPVRHYEVILTLLSVRLYTCTMKSSIGIHVRSG